MKSPTLLGSANLRKTTKDDYGHSCVFKLGPFSQVFCIKREPENRKKRDRCNLDISRNTFICQNERGPVGWALQTQCIAHS